MKSLRVLGEITIKKKKKFKVLRPSRKIYYKLRHRPLYFLKIIKSIILFCLPKRKKRKEEDSKFCFHRKKFYYLHLHPCKWNH